MPMTRFTALVAALVVSAYCATGAAAQTSAPQQQQQQQQQQPPAAAQSFNKTDLKKYANAAVAIDQISMNWQPRIQKAPANQQRALQSQAQKQMVEAVRNEGLSVSKYNQIGQASRTNSQIADQVRQYIAEAQSQ